MKFENLEFDVDRIMGEHCRVTFENGYTASVVRGPFTHGGDRGLYEVAVLHDGDLVYDTPVTEDVIGYCMPDDVTRILGEIAALPKRVPIPQPPPRHERADQQEEV